ncbi:MAG: phosphotransferase [Proteobacteria bacterium]|nr:phosphotransferase [Pseudomonadota bacterium]
MTTRPVPTDLLPWALASLSEGSQAEASPQTDSSLKIVAGDASNRRYFRLNAGDSSYIVAEAPPATEKNEAFVAVRNILAQAGVRVPQIHAVDLGRGYLLLEDLSDCSLLPELSGETVDGYYQQVIALLEKMAAIDIGNWPDDFYDLALLREELGRFTTWFVEPLLGYSLDDKERDLVQRFNTALIGSALEQPRVLVHRDFHSRNLMLQPSGKLAVIDFQDAVAGPVTYDLVSLLRDCYIRWPAGRVQGWALAYYAKMQGKGALHGVDETQFLRWFDWMGLQRHIKVLGTFARLHLRDGKPGYLDDLPVVISYVEEILEKYAREVPVFAEFQSWFNERLSPLIIGQNWMGNSRARHEGEASA